MNANTLKKEEISPKKKPKKSPKKPNNAKFKMGRIIF
jgi:hypothetical protein